METFEDLGLAPELVEALAAEGAEVPTALQRDALPVLGRGHSAVLRGGPGAGSLLAYGAPLLARTDPEEGSPQGIVLVPEREVAHRLATSLSRLAAVTGHRVAALMGPWALPTHSDLLFATPADLLASVRESEVKLDQVRCLVLDGGNVLLAEAHLALVEALLEAIPDDAQRVVVAEPISPAVRGFVEERMRRAVFLPPEEGGPTTRTDASSIRRGSLRVHTVEGAKDDQVVEVVARLLEEDVRHLLLFFRSEDRAADVGDLLALHGFAVGVPGDADVPVWLGGDPMEARHALEDGGAEGVLTLSVDVPSDPDVLDRRHGVGEEGGILLVRPRELPHLTRIAAAAGYSIDFPAQRSRGADEEVARFRAEIETVLGGTDLAGYLLLLEPLFDRHGSAQVAAALTAMLRSRAGATGSEAAPAGKSSALPDRVPPPPAFVRLFLSVGSRDGVRPGDLVGAITGETGVDGSRIGKIELRDTFARVEVEESVAAQVVKALNGTTIKGRSVRVDYDRGEQRAPEASRGRPPSGRGGREGGRGGGASRPR